MKIIRLSREREGSGFNPPSGRILLTALSINEASPCAHPWIYPKRGIASHRSVPEQSAGSVTPFVYASCSTRASLMVSWTNGDSGGVPVHTGDQIGNWHTVGEMRCRFVVRHPRLSPCENYRPKGTLSLATVVQTSETTLPSPIHKPWVSRGLS
jgi:hypothetical protein